MVSLNFLDNFEILQTLKVSPDISFQFPTMPYLYRSLALAAAISTLVTTSPTDRHARSGSRDQLLGLEKRQDANNDDF